MKRIVGAGIVLVMLCGAPPAQAATSVVTKSGCIAIDREWLTVKRDLAGVGALYKAEDVAVALDHAAQVWTSSAASVRAKGGSKVATALTRAATAAHALRVKLLKHDAKGAVQLSDTIAVALEKTVLLACAPLF